jgi:Domain of unknown function (DUF4357)
MEIGQIDYHAYPGFTMGKSIRIYLADGTVAGIRHAEMVNLTIQGIACPRNRLHELRDWPELRRPGVYFLFGYDEITGDPAIYIGEAEIVFERILNHVAKKDFWTELIAFTSKDENLTKGHIRFLESRLISIASSAQRYSIKNDTAPSTPALPRPDRDAMAEYIEAIRTLLGVLGHKTLEPLLDHEQPESRDAQSNASADPLDSQSSSIVSRQINTITASQSTYILKVSNLTAQAIQTDEGLVVLTDSVATKSEQKSLTYGYRMLRQKLVESGVLQPEGSIYRFTRDHLFSSPTQAAAVILGYSANGRKEWKTEGGLTYAEHEQATSTQLLKRLEEQ